MMKNPIKPSQGMERKKTMQDTESKSSEKVYGKKACDDDGNLEEKSSKTKKSKMLRNLTKPSQRIDRKK